MSDILELLVARIRPVLPAGMVLAPVFAGEKTKPPYATYSVVTSNNFESASGTTNLWETRARIAVFAKDFGEARAIVADMQEQLSTWATIPPLVRCSTTADVTMYEDDTRLYHLAFDARITHTKG